VAVTPAHAACGVDPEQVARSDVVFVGVLTAVAADGVATFQVEEVWRGEGWVSADETISVRASDEGLQVPPPGATFRYLVVAGERDGVIYTDDANTCAHFSFPWDDSYAAYRPTPAPITEQERFEAVGIPLLPIVIGAAVLIGVAAFTFGISGMRSRSD